MGMEEIVKKIVNMLPAIMIAGGVVFIVGMFMLLIGGTFFQQAADGNIPVDTQTVQALNQTQQNLTTTVGNVSSNVSTAVSYLPLIIILIIAIGFLAFFGLRRFGAGGGR